MLRPFASFALRSLPLVWFLALAAATTGFLVVLAAAAAAERSSSSETGWQQTQARAFSGTHLTDR
jgi:hypothetical protein